MGRFSNDNSIERAAFDRQKETCAACGKGLVWENYEKGNRGAWAAHHRDGDNTNSDLSNCVCLCVNRPENCHLNVGHVGDFAGDEVADEDASRFFFG